MIESLLRLYAGILNARLLGHTEAQGLRAETQTGFRPGCSTVHQLFVLQHCIDKTKRAYRPLFACFLDLKGAYDRVQHAMLWQVLLRLGIYGEMLAAIKSVYRDKELSVNINGRVGPAVSFQIIVKQGCPLSPTLFGLFADGLHRYLQLYCPDDGFALADGILVPDLGYADDLCCWQLVLQVYSGSWMLLAGSLPPKAMVISTPRPLCLSSTWHFLGPTSGPSMGHPYRFFLR